MSKLTPEQKRKRADYQAEYRRKNPDYVLRCREAEKPKLEMYRKATDRNKADRVIRKYLRERMLIEGWQIEITHVYKGKIQTNRKIISEGMMINSRNQVLTLTFEKMLEELGL